MAITSPTTEQLRFRSSKTGIHNLDAYLEAAEKGGRELPDLLDDLFDANGDIDPNLFQFRVNSSTYKLQVRVGQFGTSNAGYVDVPDGTFFRPTGAFITGTSYEIHDLFEDGGNLYMVTVAHVGGAIPDVTKTQIVLRGGAGAVPSTTTRLAGHKGHFLQVDSTQSGYNLVPFADSNIFYGISVNANNEFEMTVVGKTLQLAEAAVITSLQNYVTGDMTDPLVAVGFWDEYYVYNGTQRRMFDVNNDGATAPDLDDVIDLAKVIAGITTSGVAYDAYTLHIKPTLVSREAAYSNYDVNTGVDVEKLFNWALDPSPNAVNPKDYDAYFIGNGSADLSVVNNELVLTL